MASAHAGYTFGFYALVGAGALFLIAPLIQRWMHGVVSLARQGTQATQTALRAAVLHYRAGFSKIIQELLVFHPFLFVSYFEFDNVTYLLHYNFEQF